MKILVTGATGLIGTKLLEELILQGYDDLRILTRNKKKAQSTLSFPVELYEWNPDIGSLEKGALENVDVIFHLAGENIADGRWSQKRKEQIQSSRVLSTKLLIQEIKKLKTPPRKFISSSAVGIYGSSLSDTLLSTKSDLGNDYLAEVCKEWEKMVFDHDIAAMKSHSIRTGVVLSHSGGALPKMLPAFLMGVAGKLGSGKQYMSWIHIDDLVNQFIFLIRNDGKIKAYNGVAPTPVTNQEFTDVLGKVISRPTIFPVPGFVLKAALGEMSDILLKGQRVTPNDFLDEGFTFKFPTIDVALKDLLKFSNNGEVVFKKFLWINKSIPEVFEFFADDKNLEKITPPYLNFKILGKNTDTISEGTLIDYKLKVHGIPLKWKTLITSYKKNQTFTDNQLKGPYSKWVHQHDFIPCKHGTLMKDEVVYKVPMGILGRIVAGPFVKKDVTSIFEYRNEIIKANFTGHH